MRREDPPAVPQLALPVSVIIKLYNLSCTPVATPRLKTTCDLAIIAFYYLLRVGEYTKPRKVKVNGKWQRATRTVQFQIKNIGFFHHHTVVSRSAPLETLLQCTSATLRITNQKNGRMGQTMHHETITHSHGPVQALARRVHHVLSHGGSDDTLLCDYKADQTAQWTSITSQDMVSVVRTAARALGLHRQGIDPDLVGSHSLRAGGAMAMALHGIKTEVIMKHGRWTSLTFMMYIHNQIAHLSKGLSTKMSSEIPFVNIANF